MRGPVRFLSALSPPPHRAAMPATILLIENDDDLRESLSHILRAKGFRVVDVADGRAGLAAAVEEWPDLILLDLILTDMDGPTVAAKLRAEPRSATVPIVAVTGAADGAYRDALAAFDSVIEKPFRIARLLEVVEACLGVRGPLEGEGKGGGG
jgi:DNA-binding response OmpR family regulator